LGSVAQLGQERTSCSCQGYARHLAENFYQTPSQPGFNAKPTMAMAAAPEFLATYDKAGSPLANMWVHTRPGPLEKGAPAVAFYLDGKPDPNKQVNMTCYVEDVVGVEARNDGERIEVMLHEFLRLGMEETTQFLQEEGKSHVPLFMYIHKAQACAIHEQAHNQVVATILSISIDYA